MTDIINNAIETFGLQKVIDSFNPKIAYFMQTLYGIYEEIYGSDSDGSQQFVNATVESLVMRHTGWTKFSAASIDDFTRKMVRDTVLAKILSLGEKNSRDRGMLEGTKTS